MRLLLIDGHNLLFQMFFGMPNAIIGKCGRDVRGVVGFIGALGKLIRLTGATHCACFFDSEGHNARREMLPEYKENRPDFPLASDGENPFLILPDIYAALDKMGISHTEIHEGEVDDVIAAYALADLECEIVISSYDSDYFQLISDRVSVWRYRGECTTVCDSEYMEKKLGVPPHLYASYKSLVGDTADNIRGIRGIGPKTAAKLVCQYGDLDTILADTSVIKEEKQRLAIEGGRETLERNLRLIRLSADATLPFSVSEMQLSQTDFKTMKILSDVGLL
jgi:DNA polymerase-1